MNSKQLLTILIGATLIYLVARISKRRENKRLALQISAERLRRARRERKKWKRDHPFGNTNFPEYQEILRIEAGALVLLIWAEESAGNVVSLFKHQSDLNTILSQIDQTEKS